MKLIVLGGGALQVKNLKITKGIYASAFEQQVEGGADILLALRRTTGRINWASPLGRIEWMVARNRPHVITWFMEREAA